jgi:tRNA-Thr(GGU) m(6)t(6)A37 methyltransferase TsaA
MQGSTLAFVPIGRIRSEHRIPNQTPIQPVFARGSTGQAVLLPEYEKGLQDIDGFSHIFIIYHLHQAGPPRLTVKPFLQDTERGVFATRAPCRPNPIGLSLVRLVKREGCTLSLEDVDILDETPILDIKPYIERFDRVERSRSGWQEDVDDRTASERGRRGYRGPEGTPECR